MFGITFGVTVVQIMIIGLDILHFIVYVYYCRKNLITWAMILYKEMIFSAYINKYLVNNSHGVISSLYLEFHGP